MWSISEGRGAESEKSLRERVGGWEGDRKTGEPLTKFRKHHDQICLSLVLYSKASEVISGEGLLLDFSIHSRLIYICNIH